MVPEPRRDLEADEGAGGRRRHPQDGRAWTATRGRRRSACGPEFLDWLTDPVQNGGGALFDFGCYGANLMTWLMDNQRPLVGDRA